MNEDKIKAIDFLFKPRTVAIYEAKEKLDYFIEGFKSQGFKPENLYLINPTAEELFGIKCYKSIQDIPDDTIDLLILAVRREILVKSLKDILTIKKINSIHFFTAGTGEMDDIGVKIEDEIKHILDQEYPNIRAIGPNCMGVYCPSHSAFMPMFPKERGNIALIFHSGALCGRAIVYGSVRYNLKYSYGVSVGNCVNLQVSDFLEYFNQDVDTGIIGVYFEGFSRFYEFEGRKLFNLLKKMKKPVIFLIGGKSKRAQTAVLTHTGSLGTDEKIWQAIFKQTPLIEVGSSFDELIDYLFMFYVFYKNNRELTIEELISRYPKGKNALVIIGSGGMGIIDTDILTELKLNLPLFDEKTKEKLMKTYPLKIGSLSNPLDTPWISHSKGYSDLCKAAISENIDLVVMHSDSLRQGKTFEIYYNNLKSIKEYVESLYRVLILILPENPDNSRKEYYKRLIDDGFIVYPDLRRAAKAFLAFYRHGKQLKRILKNKKE